MLMSLKNNLGPSLTVYSRKHGNVQKINDVCLIKSNKLKGLLGFKVDGLGGGDAGVVEAGVGAVLLAVDEVDGVLGTIFRNMTLY